MSMTGGSALAKDDIQWMVDEAEKYAGENARRRDEAKTRNCADTFASIKSEVESTRRGQEAMPRS
jgi:molecular chaperone DnaK